MDRATVWKNLFTNWPAALPRKGVLMTEGNEQTPFQQFLTTDEFLLVQRRAPDTVGAREVIGTMIRDLDLPAECLIAFIMRADQMIVPHGHTVLEAGDLVTLVGEEEAVTAAALRFRA